MSQPIVALVGLSGVGKSTLLRQLSNDIAFQHLQASALIKEAKQAATSQTVTTDALRSADIDENQLLLVAGFKQACRPDAQLVILDGHAVIDTPTGLVHIDPQVFKEIGVGHFILLADDPEAVNLRRAADASRNRPTRTSAELADHQNAALLNTFKAASYLNVPMMVFSATHFDELRAVLTALIDVKR